MLHFILELLTLKTKHSWSDGCFNDLLRILAWLLPKQNKVLANTYRAKKLVSPFMMGVERIHVCPNHCILYRGDTFRDLDKCHVFLQVGKKTIPVTVVATMKVNPMGIKGRGRVRGIVLPQ